jgi:signal transduction histidine kinase
VAAILSLAATGYWFAIRSGLDTARDRGVRIRLVGLREYLEDTGRDSHQNLGERFAQMRNFRELYEVFDARGVLVGESKRLTLLPAPLPPPGDVGTEVTFETTGSDDFRVRIAWQKVTIDGQTFILAALDPERKYDGVLTGYTSFVFLSAPAIVLVAVLCGVWLGRRALAPIARITEDARAITESNLSTRLAVPDSRDEVQQLSETLNEMLARIEQSFSRTKQFTADASHELRAPMTLIYTAAQYALRRPRRHEELLESLQRICEESQRTARLIDDLLLLARGDAGRDNAPMEVMDVRRLVGHAAEQGATMASSKNVSVIAHIEPAELLVCTNETQLGRLLLILVDNAVKYTLNGGTVTIDARRELSFVTISITDTGVGIAAEDQPHIFERFWRADKVRSRDVSGSGLGLPIAKRIADRYNAQLDVWSEPGRGSRFTVRMKCVIADDVVTVA